MEEQLQLFVMDFSDLFIVFWLLVLFSVKGKIFLVQSPNYLPFGAQYCRFILNSFCFSLFGKKVAKQVHRSPSDTTKDFLKPVWEGKMDGMTKIGVFCPLILCQNAWQINQIQYRNLTCL